MKFHLRHLLHSFVKLGERLSYLPWQKLESLWLEKVSLWAQMQPLQRENKTTLLKSSVLCNSSNTLVLPYIHGFTSALSHNAHPPTPHTYTWHTPPLSANPPQDRAVGSGLQSASAKRGRGSQSLPAAASHTAGGASWESEPTHWDCRPWQESRGAASLMVGGEMRHQL